MENNYETLRMPGLIALAREHRLRGYSQLKKADLIAFLQNNEHQVRSPGPETSTTTPTDISLWGTPEGRYLGTIEGTTN